MRWAMRLFPAFLVLAQGAPLCEINALGSCTLFRVGTHVTDNGDGDGIADTNETVQIGISVRSYCWSWPGPGPGLSHCVGRLSTESPAIDCMRKSEVAIGNFPGYGGVVTPEETFEVKIGSIDRHDLGLTPDDPLEASLFLDIRCFDGADSIWSYETISLPLDLNVLDQGQTPVAWGEDFESGGTNPADPLQGTAFFAQNLDAGLPGNNNAEGLANSDGWRCQYSDPDWHNAASYNREQGEDCYPGVNLSHANAVFWQVDGSLVLGSPDGGRAYRGEKSLYYGIFLGIASENFTTPLSTIESVATHDLINLGAGNPQLSFWQQVSLVDDRSTITSPGRTIDRGVAQIQLYDSGGAQISDWMNLQSLQNTYAVQSETNYYNCLFDPVDDGNDEDDFFDPTDPDREFGPSSTCFPALSWSFQGSTTGAFDVAELGNAATPPEGSDEPTLGLGTWVQTKIDLSEFRGRRAKLRFLVTSLKGSSFTHFPTGFEFDKDEGDDGWWIDDIVIDETLAEPAGFENDMFLLGSCSGTGEACIGQCRLSLAPCSDASPCSEGEGDCLSPCPAGEVCSGAPPNCGGNCTQAQVNLFVEPEGPLNPVSVTRSEHDELTSVDFAAPNNPSINAEPSWLDACLDGHKEYRSCISGDPDGDLSGLPDNDCDDPWDSPICDSCPMDWSLVSAMVPPQDVVTTYAVEVRCSTAPHCRDARTIEIVVECFSGAPNSYGLREVRALSKEMLTWRGPLDVDWLRGSFTTSADIGDYVADFTDTATHATAIPMDGDPPAATGYYYLVKANGAIGLGSGTYFCSSKTWRSGGAAELLEPARNSAFGDP